MSNQAETKASEVYQFSRSYLHSVLFFIFIFIKKEPLADKLSISASLPECWSRKINKPHNVLKINQKSITVYSFADKSKTVKK